MSDSIQPSRIENLNSTEVDRPSPTGLIFFTVTNAFRLIFFSAVEVCN